MKMLRRGQAGRQAAQSSQRAWLLSPAAGHRATVSVCVCVTDVWRLPGLAGVDQSGGSIRKSASLFKLLLADSDASLLLLRRYTSHLEQRKIKARHWHFEERHSLAVLLHELIEKKMSTTLKVCVCVGVWGKLGRMLGCLNCSRLFELYRYDIMFNCLNISHNVWDITLKKKKWKKDYFDVTKSSHVE